MCNVNAAEEIAKTIKEFVDTPIIKGDYCLTDESSEMLYYVKRKLREWD